MRITKDAIDARRLQLETHRMEVLSELNACIGAIQDCMAWLKFLDQPESITINPPAVENEVELIQPASDGG